MALCFILTVVLAGLLCVTCTDLSVLGNTNYPEKWWVVDLSVYGSRFSSSNSFANYGGVPVKAEYCHEVV